MDKVQKHNLFNTNTPSSESYKKNILIMAYYWKHRSAFDFRLWHNILNSMDQNEHPYQAPHSFVHTRDFKNSFPIIIKS
jgi:hypothetical protein